MEAAKRATTAAGDGLPLIESKLQAPRRRRAVVERRRLAQHVDRDGLAPVVLVSAPAGFGKTTLVTEWLTGGRDSDGPGSRGGRGDRSTLATAWLSLDRRDSDPSVYWSYVVAALRKVDPGIGGDALATLLASPSALEAVVALLLNDLAAHADDAGDVVLVLDDYHAVESVEVHESMRFLVEHLPPQVHLVVTSRADPPWPLARLRARGDLVEVRATDLRFTGDEAAAYLNGAMGLDLTAADIGALEGRTEGWIAALQLAALSLQGRDDPSAFVAGFAGDDRFVVDYLVDEVLDRQPDDVRAFLLETSILSRLTSSLCAAVTGRSDAGATLDGLERSNLFLVALDDQRRWYRYHHLFGTVLRSRLGGDTGELHRRAAGWWSAHGDRPEAIRHALAAEDWPTAAELIELSIPELRLARQDTTQRQWLDALPPSVFENRPVLTLGLVGSHMITGDVEGVEDLLDRIEGWLSPDHAAAADLVVFDDAEMRRVPSQVAMYRAALALLRGDLAATIVEGERSAALGDADDHLATGAASALIGLAQWSGGDLQAAHDRYAAVLLAFERAGHHSDILGCSLSLADIQFAQGRLGAAHHTLTAGLEVAAAHPPLRGTADMHVGLSEVHLERNELDAAARHLQAGLDLGEHLALPQQAYRWRVVAARLRAAAGDFAGALDLLREAEQRYDTDFSPPVRPPAATTTRVRLAAGDVAGAERWAAGSGLSADDEPDYVREFEHLTLAHVLLATGDSADAHRLLRRLLPAAEAGGRAGAAIETLVLLSLACSADGDTGEARAHLADARARAEAEGFRRVFLDAGRPPAPRSQSPSRKHLVDELSPRELDVLRFLRSELTGPQIAAELVVSLNTVRSHTRSIFTKLGVTNRRAAVRRADELGL